MGGKSTNEATKASCNLLGSRFSPKWWLLSHDIQWLYKAVPKIAKLVYNSNKNSYRYIIYRSSSLVHGIDQHSHLGGTNFHHSFLHLGSRQYLRDKSVRSAPALGRRHSVSAHGGIAVAMAGPRFADPIDGWWMVSGVKQLTFSRPMGAAHGGGCLNWNGDLVWMPSFPRHNSCDGAARFILHYSRGISCPVIFHACLAHQSRWSVSISREWLITTLVFASIRIPRRSGSTALVLELWAWTVGGRWQWKKPSTTSPIFVSSLWSGHPYSLAVHGGCDNNFHRDHSSIGIAFYAFCATGFSMGNDCLGSEILLAALRWCTDEFIVVKMWESRGPRGD